MDCLQGLTPHSNAISDRQGASRMRLQSAGRERHLRLGSESIGFGFLSITSPGAMRRPAITICLLSGYSIGVQKRHGFLFEMDLFLTVATDRNLPEADCRIANLLSLRGWG